MATMCSRELQKRGWSVPLDFQEQLWHEGKVLCLHIAKIPRVEAPQMEGLTYLELLTDLLGVGGGQGYEYAIVSARIGDEWRPKQSFDDSPPKHNRARQMPDIYNFEAWGKVVGMWEQRSLPDEVFAVQYCLIFHGWGASAMLFSEMQTPGGNWSDEDDRNGYRKPSEKRLRCLLCNRHFKRPEDAEGLCVFHPG